MTIKMAPKANSTRFHPYDANKKLKIHRYNDANNSTAEKHNSNSHTHPHHQKQLHSTSSGGLSINDLKRRIRDVKRLLSHADLSPEARIVQERALAGYTKDLKDEQERRHKSEVIKRYHFVRFLDRKAATKELRIAKRQYEKVERQSEETVELVADLQRKVDIAQINVNYTIYYPLTEKYISLYPQEKKRQKSSNQSGENDNNNATDDEMLQTSEHEEQNRHGYNPDGSKPPMWYIVKKCMEDNTLEQLRDGKLNVGFDGVPIQSQGRIETTTTMTSNGLKNVNDKEEERRKKKKDKIETRRNRHDNEEEEAPEIVQDDEDSDGGFFE